MGDLENYSEKGQTGPNERVREDLSSEEGSIGKFEAFEISAEDRQTFQAAQALVTSIQQEEKTHKQHDDHLANILKEFIKTQTTGPLLDALLKLVERNVYPGFLIAMLTLIIPEIQERLHSDATPIISKHTKEVPSMEIVLSHLSNQLAQVVPNLTADLQSYFYTLELLARTHARRLLPTLSHDNGEADEWFQSLLAYELEMFMTQRAPGKPVPSLQHFSEQYYFLLMDLMAKELEGQKKLK